MKKVCFFALFIASSAWGAEWMVLKEVEDRTFYYRMESIKLVDKVHGFPSSWNVRQMEVLEDYDVRQQESDGDFYRSILKINYFICNTNTELGPGVSTRSASSGLSFTLYRRNMASGQKLLTCSWNEDGCQYPPTRFWLPFDVYERAWKIVCNKR